MSNWIASELEKLKALFNKRHTDLVARVKDLEDKVAALWAHGS